jgi:hypothetical protein
MVTEDRKFDVRTLERQFDSGAITRAEYAKHLEALADVVEKSSVMEAQFEEGVLEEEE